MATEKKNDKPMSEVHQKTVDGHQYKTFTMKRRDGTIAEFKWDKPKGSVWYLSLLHDKGAIPFPETDITKCKTIKDMLDAIGKGRGEDYASQIYMGFMYPEEISKRIGE